MIDVSRRFFCFGAAATLIVPPPKSFHIIKPPPLILAPAKPFDLPTREMLALMQKLRDQMIEMSAIPRWVVCDQAWYDAVVASEKSGPARRADRLARPRLASGDHPGDGARRVALRS